MDRLSLKFNDDKKLSKLIHNDIKILSKILMIDSISIPVYTEKRKREREKEIFMYACINKQLFTYKYNISNP